MRALVLREQRSCWARGQSKGKDSKLRADQTELLRCRIAAVGDAFSVNDSVSSRLQLLAGAPVLQFAPFFYIPGKASPESCYPRRNLSTLAGSAGGVKLSHVSAEVKGNSPTHFTGAGSRSWFGQFRNEGREYG